MRRFLLTVSFVVFAAATVYADKKASDKKDAGPDLNGVWQGFVVDGKGERADRGNVHLELKIKGNRITAKRLDGQSLPITQGTYKLLEGGQIDALGPARRGRPQPYQGICQLSAEEIRWCVSTPGNPRPADFETKGQQFLLILKRDKQ
jgi:uncharacterized protein (TIGR03067 family)